MDNHWVVPKLAVCTWTYPTNDVIRVEMLESVELLLSDGRQDGAVRPVRLAGLAWQVGLGDQRVGDGGHPLQRGQGAGKVVAADMLQGWRRKQFGSRALA